jgi:hypothetical protein
MAGATDSTTFPANGLSDEFRLHLKVRWRNLLALATGGGLIAAAGVAACLAPGGAGFGLAIVALGAVLIGAAFYLLSSIHRGEALLRTAGLRWKVETRLLQREDRSFVTLTSPDLAVGVAFEVLSDPDLGLEDVSRSRHGVSATLPPETRGWWFVSDYPLIARIHVRPRGDGAELDVRVGPTWAGWYGWVAPSGWWTWVAESERLADQIDAGLARRLPAATVVRSA